MRLKVICKSSGTLTVVFAMVLAVFAYPDIGGGSGRVKTPYKGSSAISLSDVTTVKQFASKTRTVQDLVIAGTHAPGGGNDVALMYVRGRQLSGPPMFSFEGTNDAGVKTIVDFSEIASFLVGKDQSNPSVAVVDIIQFPAISPTELLEKKPSYTDLKSRYSKSVRMRVNMNAASGRVLCLVAKNTASGPYRIIAKFSDLATNSKVDLGYGMFMWNTLPLPSIWWAVKSVTDDRSYPYRSTVKR